MRKIGIFGGSFDPIHQGHLNIAQYAKTEFELDEVWFVPAGHSPNKDEAGMTSAEIRTRMVECAIEPYSDFKLSRLEVNAKETSYTYLSLTKLKDQYPDVQFYFIMGADSLDYFEKWRHPEIICKKAIILTAVRDDMDIAEIEQKIASLKSMFEAEIYPIRGGRTDISSTKLRKVIKDSHSRPELLPKEVWQVICDNRLYGMNEID